MVHTIHLSENQIKQAIAHYVEDTCGGRVELSGVNIDDNGKTLCADVTKLDGFPPPPDGLTCDIEVNVTFSNGDKMMSGFPCIHSAAPAEIIALVQRSRVMQIKEAD